MRTINQKYSANVSGLKSQIWLEGNEERIQLRYPRYTKLGQRLLKNAGGERAILANYIRQELGLPRGEGVSTKFEFVSV